MCNAHNHRADCRCGWGGSSGSESSSLRMYPSNSILQGNSYVWPAPCNNTEIAYGELKYKWFSSAPINWPPPHPMTFPTLCWCCGTEIFGHSNANGDTVLFEPPLGPPWSRHVCATISRLSDHQIANRASWEAEKKFSDYCEIATQLPLSKTTIKLQITSSPTAFVVVSVTENRIDAILDGRRIIIRSSTPIPTTIEIGSIIEGAVDASSDVPNCTLTNSIQLRASRSRDSVATDRSSISVRANAIPNLQCKIE